jgi:glycosyltransferase involved in cell wall biosynthesis
MKQVLLKHDIELIHCNQFCSYPAAGVAGRSLGLPRICHMRNEIPPNALHWWFAYGCERILCISRHIERQVEECWPTSWARPCISTFLNPVVLPDRSSSVDEQAARLIGRRRWGIPEGAVVFGFLGQIIPIKGLIELFDALDRLPEGANWHLVIAGRDPNKGAPHEAVCREHVRKLGLERRVTFAGYVDDVRPIYQVIDAAVVPSLEEPLGRIPLEAAAYARPSIAFAVGGLPETIRHGETGWLVPAGDVTSLGRTLETCVTSPLRVFGENARAWVEASADPLRYAQSVTGLYRQLLTSR